MITERDKKMEVRRGDIYYADLSTVIGSEQGGIRPVLIVQNDVGNKYSPTVIAAAITSKKFKTQLPTHISVQADECGLAKDSIVLHNIRSKVESEVFSNIQDILCRQWSQN